MCAASGSDFKGGLDLYTLCRQYKLVIWDRVLAGERKVHLLVPTMLRMPLNRKVGMFMGVIMGVHPG